MIGIWRRLGEIVRAKGRAALVTVVDVRGSTPRDAGARMIVTPAGDYSGTIGGGELEYEAIAIARQRLSDGVAGAHLRRVALGPELGQCCGGQARLLVEYWSLERIDEIERLAKLEAAGNLITRACIVEGADFNRRPEGERKQRDAPAAALEGDVLVESFADLRHPVLLFGAGHVGRALVLALAPLPFRVTWIDSRPDPFPSMMPANVVARRLADPAVGVATAEPESFVLVMTHSHPLDLEICRAALRRDDVPYVGLIGSTTKRTRFLNRLKAAGLPPSALKRLACPIGLSGLYGKAPPEIAASVAADLLLRRQEMALAHVWSATGRRAFSSADEI